VDTILPFPAELQENSIRRTMEDEKRERTLRPAFFIGLGNTGLQVLVPLKKKLASFYDGLDEHFGQFQFLMMDMGVPEPSLADYMDKADFQALKLDNIQITVNHLKHSDAAFDQWWEHEFQPPKKELSDGTGGIRQLGRLALKANLIPILRALDSKISQSLAASRSFSKHAGVTETKLPVFIVSSACGGTGSGIVIDLLFMLHRLFHVEKGLTLDIHLFLLLPNGFIDRLYTSFKQFRLLHANTFALFRELNHLVSPEHRGAAGFWRHAIETLDETEGAAYESWRPFDHCYIIDNRAQDSQIIPLERLFGRLTRVLFSMALAPASRQAHKGPAPATGAAPPPCFYTIGFQELRYRSRALLKYMSGKLSSELLRQQIIDGSDESRGSSVIAHCQSRINYVQGMTEDILRRCKHKGGLEERNAIRKQETRAQVPRFMPFASVTKLINALEGHREFYQGEIELLLPPYREEVEEKFHEVKKKIVSAIASYVELHMEEEGPIYLKEVLHKLRSLFEDYRSSLMEKEKSLLIRQSKLGEKISEILRSVGEKKELMRNTEEFFDTLEEYGDCFVMRNIAKQHDIFISGLLENEEFKEIQYRLSGIEHFLRSLQKTLTTEMEALEGTREKEISTLFFPREEFSKSEAALRLYRTFCGEGSFEEHKSRFLQFARDFKPLGDIFLNLDKESSKLLLGILYRYGATVFTEPIMVTALKGIPRFLPGGLKEMGALLGKVIRTMEPVLLIDGGPEKLKKRLLWSTSEQDCAPLEKFSQAIFRPQNFRFSPEQDEIFLVTLFGPMSLESVETLKLCEDHYINIIEKNRDAIQKKQYVKFPIHLDRIWHQNFHTLPMIFPTR
jgi:hypothetical protein